MRQSWNQRSTSAENAPASFSPEATSISTRCRGTCSGSRVGCEIVDVAGDTPASTCPRSARRSVPTYSVISHVGYDVHNKKDAARVFYLFVTLNNATIGRVKIETSLQEWSLLSMKTLSLIL